jgi:hypothetical protein
MEEYAQEIEQYAVDECNFSDTTVLREIYTNNCRSKEHWRSFLSETSTELTSVVYSYPSLIRSNLGR